MEAPRRPKMLLRLIASRICRLSFGSKEGITQPKAKITGTEGRSILKYGDGKVLWRLYILPHKTLLVQDEYSDLIRILGYFEQLLGGIGFNGYRINKGEPQPTHQS